MHKPELQRLDLQREVAGKNPALRQAAGGEPQARLSGAPPHIAQLATVIESPDRPDPVGDFIAEIDADGFLLIL